MKLKFMLLMMMSVICAHVVCRSQDFYVGVRARYTETRLVDNPPYPPSRENRLVLSFFEVNGAGFYTPITLTDYPIYIYKEGFQFGSPMGGVWDSAGNNYDGYNTTAPRVVANHSSYCPICFDCDPYLATPYTVNGHELDCGFIQVSHWETHPDLNIDIEYFTAPNVMLTYYTWPSPYYYMNYNYTFPLIPSGLNNFYTFACASGTQQWTIRGVVPQDTSSYILPVKFANERVVVNSANNAEVSWSNMTETNIRNYIVERADVGGSFSSIGSVQPKKNNNDRADYVFTDSAISTGHRYLYRIRADEDAGDKLYSSILRLQVNGKHKPEFLIYPNPVTNNKITVQLKDMTADRYSIVLVTRSGQQRILKEIQYSGGSLTQSIDIGDVPAGIYVVVLKSATEMYSSKIVVK